MSVAGTHAQALEMHQLQGLLLWTGVPCALPLGGQFRNALGPAFSYIEHFKQLKTKASLTTRCTPGCIRLTSYHLPTCAAYPPRT